MRFFVVARELVVVVVVCDRLVAIDECLKSCFCVFVHSVNVVLGLLNEDGTETFYIFVLRSARLKGRLLAGRGRGDVVLGRRDGML